MNHRHGFSALRNFFLCSVAAVFGASCGGSHQDPVLGTPGQEVTLPTQAVPETPVVPGVPVVPIIPVDARPTVVLTSPAPGESNVSTNRTITALFSEDMDPASISAASFIVTNTTASASVPGTVTYSKAAKTATFTPAAVLPGANQYQARITTAARDVAGNALAGTVAALPNASDHTWTFSTGPAPDTTRPTVMSTVPEPGASGVTTSAPITVLFSEAMAPATIDDVSFTVTSPSGPVLGDVTYSVINRTATFLQDKALPNATQFTATIAATTADTAGNELAGNPGALPAASPYTWTFTTVQAPDNERPTVTYTLPESDEENVETARSISAGFNEPMEEDSVLKSFTVSDADGNDVTGRVSYAPVDKLVTFTPDEALAFGTVYTATITSDATDLTGNQLGTEPAAPTPSKYTWSFTTAAAPLPPTVLGHFPLGEAGCGVNATGAGFSEPMQSASITSATFLVKIGITPLTGTVSYDQGGVQALFINDGGAFPPGSTVEVTVIGGENGVKDLSGAPMEANMTYSFTTKTDQQCPGGVNLGAAEPFGGFGGDAGMTNAGTSTVINGDIGSTSVCSSFTGFHDKFDTYTIDGSNDGAVNGIVYCAPPPPGTPDKILTATQALADARVALVELQAKPGGSAQGADGELGGEDLAPGVYKAADGTYEITSDLVLDAKGDSNAVWVFQAAGTLKVGPKGPVQVTLAGDAKAENVYWAVGSAARIENLSSMVGTIIAQSTVTISTVGETGLTTLDGRAIGLDASVTMVNTVINVPGRTTPPVSIP